MGTLDSQRADDQRWVRFRIGLAGATALRILIGELDEIAPGYLADLRDRLAIAVAEGMHRPQSNEPWDGEVALQAPFDQPGLTFLPWYDAWAMEKHLFSGVASDDDHLWLFRAAVCLQLHAALEAYARTYGFEGGSLPDFIRSKVADFPAIVDEQLRELDATQQVFAHSGGVADGAYSECSPRRKVIIGERRPLTDTHLATFANAVWRAALALGPAA